MKYLTLVFAVTALPVAAHDQFHAHTHSFDIAWLSVAGIAVAAFLIRPIARRMKRAGA